jgi:hypothetical protein
MKTAYAMALRKAEETLPAQPNMGLVGNLIQQRGDFIHWVHTTFVDTSMRALAIEEGAFYFAYEDYERRIAELRRKIQELLEYQEGIVEKHRQRRMRQAVEVEQLRTAMAELKPRMAKSMREAKKILMPLEVEKERLEILKEREKHEYSRLRIQQEERRHMQQALAAQIGERSVIRARFIERLKTMIEDPDLMEQTIDEYDRALHELGGK